MKKMICLGSLAMFASINAFAQAPAAPVEELPLNVAIEWAQASIAACKANGYNVTATYMNSEYGVKLVMRADEARAGTVDIGYRKAYTVIKTGMSTYDFAKSVGIDPEAAGTPAPAGQPPGVPPGDNADAKTIVFAGGLPVVKAGKVIGAVSISGAPGGPKDVVCAEAGLAKIAGKLM